jgi:hypothetical protein
MHNFDDDDNNIDLFASIPIPTSYTLFDINANTITSCPTTYYLFKRTQSFNYHLSSQYFHNFNQNNLFHPALHDLDLTGRDNLGKGR